MSNPEMRLVSKAVRERDLTPALDRGINATWFQDPQAKEVWQVAVEHWQKYGEVPTPVAVKDTLPDISLLRVEDSYEYILDEIVAWRRRGLTIELLQGAAKQIEAEDHEQALTVLSAGLSRVGDIGVEASRDVDLTQTVDKRIDEYVELKSLPGGMRGLATGFPTIDRATSGLQSGQLITVVAQPKCGKSTLAVALMKNIHNLDVATMLISFEMSNSEQAARYDAMQAGVNHTRLLRGEMTNRDEELLRRHLGSTKDLAPLYLIDDPVSASTVSGVIAKIEKYQPRVVFIDGVYLMTDEVSGEQNTPQALTNITRNLKKVAQRFQIPVVIMTQALLWKMSSKKGVTANSIGYSSSFFQDSDVILGLQFVDEDEDPTERLLKVIASRNCPNVETTLMWNWDEAKFEEVEDF